MDLLVFKYEDEDDKILNDMTTVVIGEEIWFVATEVCALLDIKNAPAAVAALDDDEKFYTDLMRSGQTRKVNLINESGLYNLVFRSNKEGAKKFRRWVTKVVLPSIRKTGSYGINRMETPNFMIRFNDNWDKTDKGRFSVISELFIRLYGRFEKVGYQIPNKALNGQEIRPDVSVGKGFSTFLKKFHPEIADSFTYYTHSFPNGTNCQARQYSNDLLAVFLEYIDDHWIPGCAAKYFNGRDQKALEYLPKLIGR